MFLAERIERVKLTVQRRIGKWQCVKQLQALLILVYPVTLPSLLLRTLLEPPYLIVVTEYPDEGILENMKKNTDKPRRCDKRLLISVMYIGTSGESMLRIFCKIISPVFTILSYYVSYPVVGIF